jgi:hypothetical protein
MMNHRFLITAITALMCLCGLSQPANAEGMDSTGSSVSKGLTGLGLRFSGFTSMEFGQLKNYWMVSQNIQHQDLLRIYVNFGVTKQVSEGLQIQAAAEGKMYYNTFDKLNMQSVEAFVLPTMYYSFYLDRAYGVYSLGDVKSPFLQFTLGYFPFKYNPDVRDLGEYLYRSGTYPAYLVNDFDYPKARLAGLKVSSDLFGMLHQDLLLTTGTDRPPFFDLNLGYIASVDIAKILTIGVGGMYQSLLPANDSITSKPDPGNLYVKSNGDTAYYTFAGLKLMGRFSFDPKRIFYSSSDNFGIWGKEDLKLYGEISILGVQNYPANSAPNPNGGGSINPYGYDTLLHKMPIMLGFNIPTFKICDVFGMEVEWYGCTYPNEFEYKGESQILPVPLTPGNQTGGPVDPFNYSNLDNWKWCFYAKKSFKNGIFLMGQLANDHIRNETPIASSVDQEEALRTDRSWWWALKVGYKF